MVMSRRKQPRPKSVKDDAILYLLPDELQYDEQSNEIIARTNLSKSHRFGPFAAIVQIEDEIECFQLLDIQHNWLVHCSSVLNHRTVNLNLTFQNNQLFAVSKESISVGTRLCSDKIILPKLNMIKDEPVETEITTEIPISKSYRMTLDAHRQHSCPEQETTKSHSADSSITSETKSMKRKSYDIPDSSLPPTKRLSSLSQDAYCHECNILFSKVENFIQHKLHYCPTVSSSCKLKSKTIPFNCPVQIGKFIYVPIPIIASQVETPSQDNKPLDLSKPKPISQNSIVSSNSPLDLTTEKSKKIVQGQFYRCEYCSIDFRSLKTLQAHQDNYCGEYRKQKKNDTYLVTNTTDTTRSQLPSTALLSDSLNAHSRSALFICRLCQYRGNTLRGMRMHFKYHLSNNESCSDDDILIKPTIQKSITTPKPTTQSLLKCMICSAMFDYEDTLLNHIKCVHANEKFLKCLECQSRFCSKWNLIRHMKFSHTNIKDDEHESFEDKEIQSTDSMNLINQQIDMKSVEKTSANEISLKKKYSCPFCRIKFRSIDTLKQHMTDYCSSRPDVLHDRKKTMTGDNFCSLCQISFQYKTSYDAHKLYYCRSNRPTNVKVSA